MIVGDGKSSQKMIATLGDRHLYILGDLAAPLYRQMSPEAMGKGSETSIEANRLEA